jgi:DNA invertase Pin-like site-specific DNA recombinase
MSKKRDRKADEEASKVRAALYCRESDKKQENSIERQRGLVTPYAGQRGYQIVGEYVDIEAGDELVKRKDLQRLLRDAKAGQFDVVVIDEFSRVARMKHVPLVRDVIGPLEDANVRIDIVEKGNFLDWDDVGEILKNTIDGHQALEEVVRLSRRVLTGLANAAKSGRWMGGKPPYGYRKDKETGFLVIVLEEAAIVKEIFTLYLAGRSARAISHLLTERRVPVPRGNGSAWSGKTVANILRHPLYTGDMIYNRLSDGKYHSLARGAAVPRTGKGRFKNEQASWIVVKDAHKAIIDRKTFAAVQKALDGNRSAKGKRSPQKSPNAAAFVLSGLLTCGCCGHAMCGILQWVRTGFLCPGCKKRRVASLKPGKIAERCRCGTVFPIPEGGEGRPQYVCVGGHIYGGAVCRSRTVDEVDLLHVIGAYLEEVIGKPERWRDEVVRILRENAQVDPVRLAQRREALASMEAKIKIAAERYLTVPPALAADVSAALEGMRAERTRLENEVRELSEAVEATADVEAVADEVVARLRLVRYHLIITGDRDKVRAVLQRFVEKVTVEFDKSAKSASEVTCYRIKCREDAFTVANLLCDCVPILEPRVNPFSSAVNGWTASPARRFRPSTRPPAKPSARSPRATRPTSISPSRLPAKRSRTDPGRK